MGSGKERMIWGAAMAAAAALMLILIVYSLLHRPESAGWISVNEQMQALLHTDEASAGKEEEAGKKEAVDKAEAQGKNEAPGKEAAAGGDAASEREEAEQNTGEAGGPVQPEPVPKPVESKSKSTLNLNTATASQLDELPGIGPSRADAILALREKLGGKFSRTEQLLEVKGIGDKTLEKLKPLIHIE